MPIAEEVDDPDPADQGCEGDNDLPVDERGERELPPRLTIVGTNDLEPAWLARLEPDVR